MSSPAPTLPVGAQRFGKYFLAERIGVGGMAEVFRAVATGPEGFQRVFVVKRILPEMSRDPSFVQMFIDEAKISALLSHPNIVQVYEFGQIDGHYFLAMEHVHGRTLASFMGKLAAANRIAPAPIAADIARQVSLGLDYAHRLTGADGQPLGIVHRDVTPTNVMVGFNGAVKVLDFGIARAAGEARGGRTQAGVVKGKLAYIAPEQANSGGIDGRADVFALGVVLWEMLAGRRLFRADNELQALKMVLDMPIPLPSSRNPEVTPALDAVVMHALERDPERRFASAGEMAEALESYLIESRHAGQALPRLLREIFREEITAARGLQVPQATVEAGASGASGVASGAASGASSGAPGVEAGASGASSGASGASGVRRAADQEGETLDVEREFEAMATISREEFEAVSTGVRGDFEDESTTATSGRGPGTVNDQAPEDFAQQPLTVPTVASPAKDSGVAALSAQVEAPPAAAHAVKATLRMPTVAPPRAMAVPAATPAPQAVASPPATLPPLGTQSGWPPPAPGTPGRLPTLPASALAVPFGSPPGFGAGAVPPPGGVAAPGSFPPSGGMAHAGAQVPHAGPFAPTMVGPAPGAPGSAGFVTGSGPLPLAPPLAPPQAPQVTAPVKVARLKDGQSGTMRTVLSTAGVVALVAVCAVVLWVVFKSDNATARKGATAAGSQARVAAEPSETTTPPAAGASAVRATTPIVQPLVRVRVSFDSVPQGAKVFVAGDTTPAGETPFVLELPRGDGVVEVVLRKDGYRATPFKVIPDFDKPAQVILERGGGSSSSRRAQDGAKKVSSPPPSGRSAAPDIRSGGTVDPFQ